MFRKKKTAVAVVAALIFALTFFTAFLNLSSGHNWGGDFSQYIYQAKALVNGTVDQFREDNAFIINNSGEGLGLPVYPWGFPVFLSLFIRAGFNTIFLMKIPGVMLFSLSAVLVFLLSKRRGSTAAAAAGALIASFSAELSGATNTVLSDIPYCAFTLLSMLLMEELGYEKYRRKKYILAVLFGLSAMYATEIRANGFAVILTFICGLILLFIKDRIGFIKKMDFADKITWDPGKKPAIAAIISYGIGVLAFRVILPGSPESASMFGSNMIGTIVSNTERNLLIMRKLFSFNDDNLNYMLFAAFLLLALTGFILQFEKNFLLAIYCAGSFFLYMIWPYYQKMRFMYSIAFLMIPAAVSGYELVKKKSRISLVIAAVTVSVLLLSGTMLTYNGYQQTFVKHRETEKGSYSPDALATYEYIKENTSEDSVIIFEKPRVLYLNTGRLGYCRNSRKVFEDLTADYVLLCSELDMYSEE
ncbi:MAG: hypothetical protein K6E33_09050, partial [Lachnospiraceae bacterium]|nr:hypothetical protein [Lachnospiraceae bacterium]